MLCFNEEFVNIKEFDSFFEYFDYITGKLSMFENHNCVLFR